MKAPEVLDRFLMVFGNASYHTSSLFLYFLVISGAIYVGGDLHVDGSARFQDCHAESAGGAIYVDGDFWQSGLHPDSQKLCHSISYFFCNSSRMFQLSHWVLYFFVHL